MRLEMELNNIHYILKYKPISDVKFYKPLLKALWALITERQQKRLILIRLDGVKIINFDSLLNLFEFNRQAEIDYFRLKQIVKRTPEIDDELNTYSNIKVDDIITCKCICGVCITYESIIKHRATNQFYIIGSECIKWWHNPDLNRYVKHNHDIIKAKAEGIEPPLFCSFCFCKRACIMCKSKGLISNIFKRWHKYTNDKNSNIITIMKNKVEFGKYDGKQYINLCRDTYYCDWIFKPEVTMKNKSDIITRIKIYRKYKKLIHKRLFNAIIKKRINN